MIEVKRIEKTTIRIRKKVPKRKVSGIWLEEFNLIDEKKMLVQIVWRIM